MSWADDEGYYFDEDMLPQGPEFEYETGYWETKDGKRIPIRKMELHHIKNCIRWLKQALEKAGAIADYDRMEAEAKIEEFEEELERRTSKNLKGKGEF